MESIEERRKRLNRERVRRCRQKTTEPLINVVKTCVKMLSESLLSEANKEQVKLATECNF